MTLIVLAQPLSFDGTPSVPNGDWLRLLFASPGHFTVESATADKVVLAVTDPVFAGYKLSIAPADHFALTPGAAQPFSGAIGEIVLLDRDGGTVSVVDHLPALATLAALGDGSVLAGFDLEIDGSPGADTIVGVAGGAVLAGGGGGDLIRGGFDDGDDTLIGGPGADTLDAGAGDDDIVAGDGADLIDGGTGFDYLYLTETPGPIEAWFDQAAPVGGLRISNVEVVFTNDAGARLHGGAADDVFYAGAGADELHGGDGDDLMDGGMGADLLDGGAGMDGVDYSYAPAGVMIDLGLAAPQQTAMGLDTLVSIEGVFGSSYSDTLTGAASDDFLAGQLGEDLLSGGAGDDILLGGTGSDREFGGLGNDSIVESSGQNYLRGDEGDDVILGGTGFDDANGNMGNDTVSTGPGDDYAVGGKDNDMLFGDAGVDIVWGNLGADTCDGGDGNDQVRGGQGDDTIAGGAGDDFVSGDRGDDTVSGGAGADLFHGSQDAGVDRVVDFNVAEGDRVFLDPGTTYTISQVGADTLISMGGSNQMILVGVQMASLPPGWIFGA